MMLLVNFSGGRIATTCIKIISLARKVLDSYKFIPNDHGKYFFKTPSSLLRGTNDPITKIFCDFALEPVMIRQLMSLQFGLVKICFLWVL